MCGKSAPLGALSKEAMRRLDKSEPIFLTSYGLFCSSTILMLDLEKWIRGLPPHDGAKADQDSMRLSPREGVNITFDRYVMTVDGFLPRREFRGYKIRKRIEVFREMSKEGKLYVARSEVNGKAS